MGTGADPDRYLAIYLNDHLAGATVGVELARRLRSENQTEPRFGGELARICKEIEGDKAALERLLDQFEVGRDRLKPALALAGERLGRLKPNGRLRGYSPLSRVLELEVLSGLVGGKLQLWNALEQRFGETLDGFDFHDLAARADDQGRRLEDLHLAAAGQAFGPTA
jgi:hypothetical protein